MVNIEEISPNVISNQIEYNTQDRTLMSSFEVDTKLDSTGYIEYSIYDLNNNLLNIEDNYTSYTVLNDGQSAQSDEINKIEVNPETDLENLGYNQGEFNVYYNILSREVGSSLEQLFISEISSDRTEIRLDSNNLTNALLQEQVENFAFKRQESEYFLDFYVNFGNNNLLIANNIALDTDDENFNTTVL